MLVIENCVGHSRVKKVFSCFEGVPTWKEKVLENLMHKGKQNSISTDRPAALFHSRKRRLLPDLLTQTDCIATLQGSPLKASEAAQ